MLTRLTNSLAKGTGALLRYRELWVTVIFALVLPVLFYLLMQSIFSTATSVITTAYKDRVATIQDALSLSIENTTVTTDLLTELVDKLLANYTDILLIAIMKQEGNQVRTLVSSDKTTVGTIATSSDIERTSLARMGESYIFEYAATDARVWRVYRAVQASDGAIYFIYSVHSLSSRDAALASKVSNVYALFIFIILVLLLFAYISARQVNYRLKYELSLETAKAQDLFMAAVVHELRAPLTAVRGYASLIEETVDTSSEVRGYASTIKLSAARLVALIGDYLNAIKIQSTQLISPQSVDLKMVLSGVVTELTPQAADKHLRIEIQSSLASPLITADRSYVTQIITNVISNAIKYTDNGGIEVAIHEKGRLIEVRVKDTGFGITSEDQKRLFAPFSRVGDTEQMKNITGSGLGMWMTKLMMDKLGGSITIESIKGVGTHVILLFKK